MSDAPSLLTGISLTAAFLGGMVALFAPCCITFLFPSYLGTIFKEKGRVVFLTFVFAAGLSTILVPVALGFRLIVQLFDQFHTTTYLLGSLIMILLGLATLFEAKIKIPFLPRFEMPQSITSGSTFLLGVFSGITSSCCAPVLFAAITLSSLSPTLFLAAIVALVYVAGIVFPLFFLSLLYDRLTNSKLFLIKKSVNQPLKIAASFIFIVSGVLIAYFALTGKITMSEENLMFASSLRSFIYSLSQRFSNSLIDGVTLLVIVILLSIMIRRAKNEKDKSN